MRNTRRDMIDRSEIDEQETPAPTLADVDAALYGKIARVDSQRRAVERTRFGAFKLTAVGLEIGENAQKKDWEEVGNFIFQVESGIQWMIGDWLIHGVKLSYGDMPKLAKDLGRDESTLHTYKQMCENIESTRRRVDLSFGHHQVVRTLDKGQQDDALAYAAEHKLSVAEFRKWLRESKPALAHKEPEVTEQDWAKVQYVFTDPHIINSLTKDERREAIKSVEKVLRLWKSLDSE